jgi:hypothetical protein
MTSLSMMNNPPFDPQVDQFIEFQRNASAYWAGINNASIPSRPKYPRPEFFSQGIYTAHSGGNDLLFFRVNNYSTALGPEYLQNMTNIYEDWARVRGIDLPLSRPLSVCNSSRTS